MHLQMMEVILDLGCNALSDSGPHIGKLFPFRFSVLALLSAQLQYAQYAL